MLWWMWLAALAGSILIAGGVIFAAPYYGLAVKRHDDSSLLPITAPPPARRGRTAISAAGLPGLERTAESRDRHTTLPIETGARVKTTFGEPEERRPTTRPRPPRTPTTSLQSFL